MGKPINLNIERSSEVTLEIPKSTGISFTLGSGSGTKNYEVLNNKPRINGVELVGNRTSDEIYVQGVMEEVTPQEIDNIIYGG